MLRPSSREAADTPTSLQGGWEENTGIKSNILPPCTNNAVFVPATQSPTTTTHVPGTNKFGPACYEPPAALKATPEITARYRRTLTAVTALRDQGYTFEEIESFTFVDSATELDTAKDFEPGDRDIVVLKPSEQYVLEGATTPGSVPVIATHSFERLHHINGKPTWIRRYWGEGMRFNLLSSNTLGEHGISTYSDARKHSRGMYVCHPTKDPRDPANRTRLVKFGGLWALPNPSRRNSLRAIPHTDHACDATVLTATRAPREPTVATVAAGVRTHRPRRRGRRHKPKPVQDKSVGGENRRVQFPVQPVTEYHPPPTASTSAPSRRGEDWDEANRTPSPSKSGTRTIRVLGNVY